MRTMTIRNIPAELAHALDKERRRRGISLNRTEEHVKDAVGGRGDTTDPTTASCWRPMSSSPICCLAIARSGG